jgi:hypothetical protein
MAIAAKGNAMSSIIEELYPHVVEGLTSNWGEIDQFEAFMDDLMFDKRGNRRGWPEPAWDELRFLQVLHAFVFKGELPYSEVELDDSIKWV